MKTIFFLFLTIIPSQMFDFSSFLHISNHGKTFLIPTYDEPKHGEWTRKPTDIKPYQSIQISCKDSFGTEGSDFQVRYYNPNENLEIFIHMATNTGFSDNEFSVNIQKNNGYSYSYYMMCGDQQKENDVVKKGHPCSIILSFRQKSYIKYIDLVNSQGYSNEKETNLFNQYTKQGVQNVSLRFKYGLKDKKKLQLDFIPTNFGKLNSVSCIFEVYYDDELVCYQTINSKDNYILMNGFRYVNYNPHQGEIIQYNLQNTPLQSRIWKDNRQDYYLSMMGFSQQCIPGQVVQCQGYFRITDPLVNTLKSSYQLGKMDGQESIMYFKILITAIGINDMFDSEYNYIQVVNNGNRYIVAEINNRQVQIPVVQKLQNCLDSDGKIVYFSTSQVSPYGAINAQMLDQPGDTYVCKNKCYVDEQGNMHRVGRLVGEDSFTAYIVRKIVNQNNDDTPLQAVDWSYVTTATNVQKGWNVQTNSYSVESRKVQNLPTWKSSCTDVKLLLRCSYFVIDGKSYKCWGNLKTIQKYGKKMED